MASCQSRLRETTPCSDPVFFYFLWSVGFSHSLIVDSNKCISLGMQWSLQDDCCSSVVENKSLIPLSGRSEVKAVQNAETGAEPWGNVECLRSRSAVVGQTALTKTGRSTLPMVVSSGLHHFVRELG